MHKTLNLIAGDWLSRTYLALCLGLLTWALADTAFVDHQDASFAGVIPIMASAPGSLILLLLPEAMGGASLIIAVVVGAVANAALISWCVRAIRRGTQTARAQQG